ncbi:MAG: hypothetical protein ACYCXW_05175 [Solirubrobacteraceae bacterium]
MLRRSTDPPVPAGGFFTLIVPGAVRGQLVRELYLTEQQLHDAEGTPAGLELRELLQRVPVSYSYLKQAITDLAYYELVHGEPVARDRRSGQPDRRRVPVERRGARPNGRRKRERLTFAGGLLAEIALEADALAVRLPRELHDPASGNSLLAMIGPHVRHQIADALLDGDETYSELLARMRLLMPTLASSTFRDNLRALINGGLVARVAGGPGESERYRLTPLAGHIARVILLAARFRLAITPNSAPWMAGNLARFVKLLAREGELRGTRSRGLRVLGRILGGCRESCEHGGCAWACRRAGP